jgi:hypothetical protein
MPPSRSDIEAEIVAADERRARSDREGRADAAATVLRWLIGKDDHVPVRGENRGELVGGFGDVVRSQDQIADLLTLATERQQRAMTEARGITAGSRDRQLAQQETDYLGGVIATFTWLLGQQSETPITHVFRREPTTRDLKSERVHAEDVIEQARSQWLSGGGPSPWYARAVKVSITWLVGDQIISPVDPSGLTPTASGANFP